MFFGKKDFGSSVDYIIAGLGNPGSQYDLTRHNAGFRCIDLLADQLGCKIDKLKFQGLYCQTNYNGCKLFLLKPQTYMNLSGRSVLQLSAYFNIPPQRIIVLFDDISLPPGRIRSRRDGSAGGHNGMKSLIAHLGGEKFPRIRVGIGAPGQKEMVGHVLGKFAPDERPLLEECLAKAEEATVMMIREGFQAAANKFNVKKEKKPRKKPQPEGEAAAPENAENPPPPPESAE